jgi:hypothetical protein
MEAVKATNTLVEEEIAGIENAVSAANNQLSEEKVAMLDEMLVDYRSGTLNEMLSWFQRTHGVGLADVRPTFYGMRKNSGLHLNQRILNAALEKCLSDKQRTGGSLSQLVELLLWQYLGSPDEFLRPGPEPEPNPHKLRRAKTHEGE